MEPRPAPVGLAGQTPRIARRVFVTGANGFVGRALLVRHRELGAEVCGMDVRADAEWNVVAGDLGESGPWQAHAKGCDLVIHTAAVVSNIAPAELYRRVSVGGTRRALDAAIAAGARRFVHVSSVGAYGWHRPPDTDEKTPITVLSGNAYQDAKAASEHPVLTAHCAGEIACTIVRPTDVYGPASRPWVLLPLEMIRKGLFLLPAHGRGRFAPIYIDDLVDGILLAAGLDAGAGQIFNLTGFAPVPTAEFFSHHVRWAGRSGPPRSFSTPAAIRIATLAAFVGRLLGRPTEASGQTMLMLSKEHGVSGEKARRVLGYTPRVDLAEGMRRTETWLREQGLLSVDRSP
ncbi:MAG: NAD-dependent epimerase/dehydratase family protein [Deltaproteobacteria bacterium]|nr:NAD-dependent epimerase/dehydratase family protein [Deltaproteobacteria bacterium]